MRLAALIAFSSALGACAADTADLTDSPDVRTRAPLGTHTSADPPQAVARCIVRRVPGASVVPGDTPSVIDVQNRDTRPSIAWEVRSTRTGSLITVWSSNSRARALAQAEACF
jgi:hypothetical protein